eukprot:CAMPEP_0115202472 /NCGR_PEP_ID=MMETSP0270-20121206/18150_1 /TAXON_ID=71861 /ORGANISM="Scrippsiella trochoidea, Strain CCMP3099" /LENGTH=171 /DNA_ID=CAMNT_0002615899 /DNA_START=570 /DNA_END=1085 /DNA_ORIENTATION=+
MPSPPSIHRANFVSGSSSRFTFASGASTGNWRAPLGSNAISEARAWRSGVNSRPSSEWRELIELLMASSVLMSDTESEGILPPSISPLASHPTASVAPSVRAVAPSVKTLAPLVSASKASSANLVVAPFVSAEAPFVRASAPLVSASNASSASTSGLAIILKAGMPAEGRH